MWYGDFNVLHAVFRHKVDICHDSCGRYYLVGKILKKFFGILDADYLAGVVNADEERSAMSVGE
mgnify:CR=1